MGWPALGSGEIPAHGLAEADEICRTYAASSDDIGGDAMERMVWFAAMSAPQISLASRVFDYMEISTSSDDVI